jgi:hypothetical protein
MIAVAHAAARRGARAVRQVAVVAVRVVAVVQAVATIVALRAPIVRLTLVPQPQQLRPQRRVAMRRSRLQSSAFARLQCLRRLTPKENKNAATCTQKIS